MSVKFNPIRCTDGTDRAFMRVEFPITRNEVVARLTYWHATHRDTGEIPTHQVRAIVTRHFEQHGVGRDGEDEWITPTNADIAWARAHTLKAWPGPEPADVLTTDDDPDCPHGCGTLHWADDQWYCPGCGDEFAEPFTPTPAT